MGKFPELMFGTGASAAKDYDSMKCVVKKALEHNITGFDTAPSYGTEAQLSKILHECASELGMSRGDIFIQSKIDAWQMQEGPDKIKEYLHNTMNAMNLDYIDSLLIHWPIPEYMDDTWKTFIQLKKQNIVRHVGVCNVRKRQLLSFLDYEFLPEIIQIERNPLFTCIDEVEFCLNNNISIQAYSPLCKMDARIRDNEFLLSLAKKYNKNVGQIVLRWHIDTGVVPIFTSKNPDRVLQYSTLNDFSLDKNEVSEINKMNLNYKLYLESWACPGF